ncbi:MAG: hypothetical protein ACE3L7_30020 [Candidatus Pristimantibacillus sp.]
MKRIILYTLIAAVSFIISMFFFRTLAEFLKIEHAFLHRGLTIFYIIMVVPANITALYILRFAGCHSIIAHAVILTLFGIIPTTGVPIISGMGLYSLTPDYFQSSLALILFSFFTVSAVTFSICSSIVEKRS